MGPICQGLGSGSMLTQGYAPPPPRRVPDPPVLRPGGALGGSTDELRAGTWVVAWRLDARAVTGVVLEVEGPPWVGPAGEDPLDWSEVTWYAIAGSAGWPPAVRHGGSAQPVHMTLPFAVRFPLRSVV